MSDIVKLAQIVAELDERAAGVSVATDIAGERR